MNSRVRLILVATAIAGLSACGSDPEPEAAAPSAPPSTKPVVPAEQSPVDPTAKMARAVSSGGKPGAAVDIKYDFRGRPEVGKPIEVKLAFIPNPGVESITAKITDMDGITVAGALNPQFNNVQGGQPYEHTFSLLANREGVFYVSVEVTTQIGGATSSRTYSIPLAVGTTPARQEKPAEKDDSGQAIKPMQAVES
jgi:hypothetical protein